MILPKRGLTANVMLSYVNLTGAGGDGCKYVPRFKQMKRWRKVGK